MGWEAEHIKKLEAQVERLQDMLAKERSYNAEWAAKWNAASGRADRLENALREIYNTTVRQINTLGET
jgi:hypothetical protein